MKWHESYQILLCSWIKPWVHSVCGVALDKVQGYLADEKPPLPLEHRRHLGIVLLYDPRGGRFLMGEVPL